MKNNNNWHQLSVKRSNSHVMKKPSFNKSEAKQMKLFQKKHLCKIPS